MSSTDQSSLGIDAQSGKLAIVQVAPGSSIAGWASENRDALRASVTEHGAVLVRGLGLQDASAVSAAFHELSTDLISDREPFAIRSKITEGVYSTTPWQPGQPMCMHNEMSYVAEPAGLMMFACLTAPASGGATGVSDTTAILKALPDGLVKRFEQDGWILTRNYNEEIGSSYSEAFGTENKGEIEAYCKASNIELEWLSDGALKTRQRRQTIVNHPVTGERCWFNQIAFLNEWTLDPEIREYLVEVYGRDGLPFNTSLGNGDPITEDMVETINNTYDSCTMQEPWQAGDLMLVDNIRMAHSKEGFKGDREVLVGMANPVRF